LIINYDDSLSTIMNKVSFSLDDFINIKGEVKYDNINEVYIDLKPLYCDPINKSGIFIYYRRLVIDSTYLSPRYINGTPYSVLIINNLKPFFFSQNINTNKKIIKKYERHNKPLPASLKNDSSFLRNYVLR
jgi:hypothetical protein